MFLSDFSIFSRTVSGSKIKLTGKELKIVSRAYKYEKNWL